MGKYDTVNRNLERAAPEESPRQQRIDVAKQELLSNMSITAAVLSHLWKELRLQKSELESQLDEVGVQLSAAEQLMEDVYLHDKISSVKLDDGRSVSLEHSPQAVVKDREQYRLWCIENGYEGELRLWPSTTDAIVKERLLSGQELPAGVEAYLRTKWVLR